MIRGIKFVTLCLLLTCAQEAWSCSCSPPRPGESPRVFAERRIANSDVIFMGKVKSIVTPFPFHLKAGKTVVIGREVEFEVSKTFKGGAADTLEIFTGLGGGDCGYPFRVGEEYVVFADREDRVLRTGVCSGTSPLSEAGELLSYLRGEAVDGHPSEVAVFHERDFAEVCGKVSDIPAGVKLRALLLAEQDELGTRESDGDVNSDGEFCIRNVVPGKYLLAVVDEKSAEQSEDDEPVPVGIRYLGNYREAESSQDTMIRLEPGEKLKGLSVHGAIRKSFNLAGTLSPELQSGGNFEVMLVGKQLPHLYFATRSTDRRFQFRNVPSGEYVIFAISKDEEADESNWSIHALTDSISINIDANLSDFVLK